jgi:ABC-type multidrug transport system fused ATPase/permease subunit
MATKVSLCRYAATGDIALKGVTFAYPMRPSSPVLSDVNVTLRHGEVTAIVGRSGAGKSTVASLISRFYTPDMGVITMGGVDIHAWSRCAWSDAVALVAQEPVLFAGTVADNIAYGRPRAMQADIRAAAEAANAHEFITGLEDGCAPPRFVCSPSHSVGAGVWTRPLATDSASLFRTVAQAIGWNC